MSHYHFQPIREQGRLILDTVLASPEFAECSMKETLTFRLACEEIIMNVIFYAYPEGTSADITLTAESDGQELTFVLSDTGKPFDPTAKEDADIDVNPMDREQGGMGILIVKNIMNEVSYQRLGEENRLTMKKKL